MRKNHFRIITVLLLSLFVFLLSSCGEVEEHEHTYESDWSYDETYHYHKCNFKGCDAVYKKGEHQFEDDTCKICGYVKGEDIDNPDEEKVFYTVTFKDGDEVLKTERVLKGSKATAPDLDNKGNLLFIKWDKSFSKVESDLTVNAIFGDINSTYSINYNLDGFEWGFSSKDDMVLAFLTDFYNFVKPSIDIATFIYSSDGSFDGAWSRYVGGSVGGSNHLLEDNNVDLEEYNDEYFFNSHEYRDKWYPLFIYGRDQICKGNQRFGTKDYYYGILDFYRYIIGNYAKEEYLEIYGGVEVFYGYPEMMPEVLENYKYSDNDIKLPIPYSIKFVKWIDEFGDEVDTINKNTIGDYNLTAVFNKNNSYVIKLDSNGGNNLESINVEKGGTFELPTPTKEGYIFTGWYLGNSKFSQNKYLYDFNIKLIAGWRDEHEIELEDLVYHDNPVKYRNSDVIVQIPTEYRQKDEQLRAAWVSSFAGDFSPSTDKEMMKSTLTDILDVLEYFNMNCVIFHIRTHNQAFYKTTKTYIASEYGTLESFEEWDYLTWFIDECHKRGIEFHAWLNPYRCSSSGSTAEAIAEKFKDYPDNPASKVENLLVGSNGYVLMDPAIPEVRSFVRDVCIEIMDNYDVDAIHFDDYFYTNGIDDSASRSKYNTKNLSVDNFRREQVDLFIEDLFKAMCAENKKNDTKVQLGISPTGIYRNGNGSVESGSNTSGYAHYGSPLYADTYKWIRNEWIDYILPQSYWAFSHSSAGYADVMDWWDKAVEGTRVNLYSGIGLYMANNGGSNASWGKEPYEVSNQVLYTTKLKNVKGISFYAFQSLRSAYRDSSAMAHAGVMRIHDEYWTTKVKTPTSIASLLKDNGYNPL